MAFSGFDSPKSNYTPMPNDLIEALPEIETLAEMKVVFYILRHTWGYQEFDEGKRISLDEFQNGRKRADGTRLDSGVGMVENSIINGLERAIAHGFIKVKKDKSDEARIKKYYRLRMAGEEIDPPPSKVEEGTPPAKIEGASSKVEEGQGVPPSKVEDRTEKETPLKDTYQKDTDSFPALQEGEPPKIRATIFGAGWNTARASKTPTLEESPKTPPGSATVPLAPKLDFGPPIGFGNPVPCERCGTTEGVRRVGNNFHCDPCWDYLKNAPEGNTPAEPEIDFGIVVEEQPAKPPAKTAKPKVKKVKKPREAWSDLTDGLYAGIPAEFRPIKVHYAAHNANAKALYEAGFTRQDVQDFVEFMYANDLYWMSLDDKLAHRVMWMSSVAEKIKATLPAAKRWITDGRPERVKQNGNRTPNLALAARHEQPSAAMDGATTSRQSGDAGGQDQPSDEAARRQRELNEVLNASDARRLERLSKLRGNGNSQGISPFGRPSVREGVPVPDVPSAPTPPETA